MASGYFHLGTLAHQRGKFPEAEEQYRQAIAVGEEIGFKPGLAGAYYHLGMLILDRERPGEAQGRERLDEAEKLLGKALRIYEELGDKAGIGRVFHTFGRIAELRWSLSKARDGWRRQRAQYWYQRSLELKEECGDRVGMAIMFGQLGQLAIAQGNLQGALEWTIKCAQAFNALAHPRAAQAIRQLAALAYAISEEFDRESGIEFLRQGWSEITGEPLPPEVLRFLSEWNDE